MWGDDGHCVRTQKKCHYLAIAQDAFRIITQFSFFYLHIKVNIFLVANESTYSQLVQQIFYSLLLDKPYNAQ
jgi:hypothetical protein